MHQQLLLRNRIELFRSYITLSEPRDAVPTAAYIETTSRCNLECPMCARQLAGPEWHDRDMSLDELERALDTLAPQCELVLPFAGGEPLLYPHTVRVIERCTQEGRRTELATNATLLGGRIARDLILAGLDTLVISLDAARSDTYAKIRRGGEFERTRTGIMALLRTKRRLESDLWVVIQMVVLPENQHEIKEFQRQWKNVEGVDIVRMKSDEVHVERVRERQFGAVVPQRPCHFPWLGPLMIRYDGGVYPCCHSWRGEPVGHISEQTTSEIWTGPAMAALRRAHAEGRAGDEYPACRECQAVVPHPMLVSGSLFTPTYVTRRAIPYFEALNRRFGQRLIRTMG